MNTSSQYGRRLSSAKVGTSSRQPNLEMDRPLYEYDPSSSHCTVKGEIDLDISMFQRLPYSIGVGLLSDDKTTRIDWNQDGPGNYNRSSSHSLIRIQPRVIVDQFCFVRFSIKIPAEVLTAMRGRAFSVEVRAYALEDPFIAAKPVSTSFKVVTATSGVRRGSTVRT